jgi:hypothetical protein
MAVVIQSQQRQYNVAEALKKGGWRITSEQTWLGKLLRRETLERVTAAQYSGPNTLSISKRR